MPEHLHPASDLPLVWSIMSSSAAVQGIGLAPLCRAIERGDFAGTMEGVDEDGNSIVGAFLRATGGTAFRLNGWARHRQPELPLLCALLAHGSSPWLCDTSGLDAVDRMFHAGMDALLVELTPSDPMGPGAWKTRLHSHGNMTLPWLHSVVRHSHDVVGELKILSGLPEVDFNQQDAQGNTPLFHASNRAVVEFLLEHGANPSHRNHAGEGALAAWSTGSIPASEMSAMKQLLIRHGLQASREDEIADFHKLAQTAPTGMLSPIYRQLELDKAPPVALLENAYHRLMDCQMYGRQEARVAWGWLEFLAAEPGVLENLPVATRARLHFLSLGVSLDKEEANQPARDRLRDLLVLRAPMTLEDMWANFPREDIQEHKYSVNCLFLLQQYLESQLMSGCEDKALVQGMWFAIELRQDMEAVSSTRQGGPHLPWRAKKTPLPLEDHPGAWSLLAVRSDRLDLKEFEREIDYLLARGTPIPGNGVVQAQDADPQRQALMERAIYQQLTPQSPPRPSRRF